MKRWEHKHESVRSVDAEKRADQLGQEGWELISAFPLPETHRLSLFFKRLVGLQAPACLCRSIHGDDPKCPKHGKAEA